MMPAWLNPGSLSEEVPNFSKVQSDLGIEKATLEAKHTPKVPFSSQVLSSRLKSGRRLPNHVLVTCSFCSPMCKAEMWTSPVLAVAC